MSLLDLAARDLRTVFLNPRDFAVDATLRPRGTGPGRTLRCQVIRPAASQESTDGLLTTTQQITVIAVRADAQAIALELDGASRDPARGDTITDAIGELVVDHADPDDVGGIVLVCRDPRSVQIGTGVIS